jgi:hypothetical protein
VPIRLFGGVAVSASLMSRELYCLYKLRTCYKALTSSWMNFIFGADELSYIKDNCALLDHDDTFRAS